MPAFALTIFTGAFLLFQVQPLIGKYILPWFGGGPGVWTTCMLFFQVLLLGGYAYAHVISRFRPRMQAVVHLVLVAGALALLPITPSDTWKPSGGDEPTLHILALLAACLGLPYFVLSSTGPLMQQWFSRANPGRSPYRLYALSNAASLLALVTYPFLVENHLARHTQATVWGCGLMLYAVCCGLCALRLWKEEGRRPKGAETEAAEPIASDIQHTPCPAALVRFLWLLLPACASVLLLATTNKLCQEITVIPFLWVLPLALYLLSFIICFDSPRWYGRMPFGLALLAAFGGLYAAAAYGTAWPLWQLVAIYAGTLFVCCMICHGELYRLRPDPTRLTAFYLMIAAGGALGGVFVAVAAPLLFAGYSELQWGLLGCALLFLLVCATSSRARHSVPADRVLNGAQAAKRLGQWLAASPVWLAISSVVLGGLLWARPDKDPSEILASRNFYGVLRVLERHMADPKQDMLGLMHGRILHGLQFIDPEQAARPTLYYGEQSGIGVVMRALPAGSHRVGLVGLGVGTLADYAHSGDYFRFYEINPEVQRIANSRFTCLRRCAGKLEVAPGDARLTMEREPPQRFDLLVLDAFSGDAIPAHLLTREAFSLYARHLKPNSIIALHISNRYLDLEPLLVNFARRLHYGLAVIETSPMPDEWWLHPAVWVLMSKDAANLDLRPIQDAARPERSGSEEVPLWTDDFTSVFHILKSGSDAQIDPGVAGADLALASRATEEGNLAEAIARYRLILKSRPNLVLGLNNLAWLLATSPDSSLRNGPEAAQLAERACRLSRYCVPRLVGTLAAAYAEAGRFPEAITMARKACARAANDPALLEKNRQLLALYQKGQSYHEPARQNNQLNPMLPPP